MAITFTNLVGDWRRIVEDYVTDPANAADAPGVEGTITVTPMLGEGRHAPKGVPSGGVFYTFAPLDLRVYRGLLMDENMNSDITVAIEVDEYPVAWRARFDLQYRRIKIPLQDVIFGPNEVLGGQVNLSSLVARDGLPPEYEGSYVQLMDAVRAAADHADRAEAAAGNVDAAVAGAADVVVQAVEADRVAAEAARTGAELARDAAGLSATNASTSAGQAAASATTASQGAQVITTNLAAINAAPGHATAAQTARTGAETAQGAASGSATAAAGSASAANSSAGTATAQAGVASTAAGTATARAGEAAGSATAAATSAGVAQGHADDAELWATSFGLSATATTSAPGTAASVTVTGDGPEYGLAFTVPRGDKGPKGDDGEVSQAALDAAVASLVDNAPEALNTLSELATSLGNDPNFATTVSTEIGKRALVDGAPAAYNTLGKLVSALVAGDLGGSTDAGVLTGALTDQVDASAAIVTGYEYSMPLMDMLDNLIELAGILSGKSDAGHTHTTAQVTGLDAALAGKAPTSHSHTAAEVGAKPASYVPAWSEVTGKPTTFPPTIGTTASTAKAGNYAPAWSEVSGKPTTFTPATHTHTKSEVGLGNVDNTSDANKPVSTAQQAAINAKVTNAGGASGLWVGTTASLPTTGTTGVLYVTY